MAQKYIIGDLVKYKVGGLEFIAEITNTSKYGYCFKGVSDDISGTLCKEFAKDIPLTTEILKKNGYKKKMYCDWCYYLPIEGNLLYLSKGTGIDGAFSACVGQDMSYVASINFVHQLQHLLFGLGLNSEMKV